MILSALLSIETCIAVTLRCTGEIIKPDVVVPMIARATQSGLVNFDQGPLSKYIFTSHESECITTIAKTKSSSSDTKFLESVYEALELAHVKDSIEMMPAIWAMVQDGSIWTEVTTDPVIKSVKSSLKWMGEPSSDENSNSVKDLNEAAILEFVNDYFDGSELMKKQIDRHLNEYFIFKSLEIIKTQSRYL